MSDDEPGITRRRCGKGFAYYDLDGRRITDEGELARIRSLAVPPAWTDVWISPREDTHVQATGRDAKGRKQYRYHDEWRRLRDRVKYGRLVDFASCLGRVRARVRRDLRRPGAPKEKVLAAVVRLLDRSLIRIGNPEYARDNGSYGLTTLRDRHVEVRGSRLRLAFRGKAGKDIEVDLDDARLAKAVKQCRELPGYQLFQYVDEDGNRCSIDSGDVNDYLREITGQDFTSKDFRTWGATVLALEALCAGEPVPGSLKQQARAAIEMVADELNNTPAVCRSSYVHPAVIDAHANGGLDALEPVEGSRWRELTVAERRLLALLQRAERRRRGRDRAAA